MAELPLSSFQPGARESRRTSKSGVQERMLRIGLDVVQQVGLTVSLEHIRVDELMSAAGVPKASFYRIWKSKEAYLGDLLEGALAPNEAGAAAFDPSTLKAAGRVIREHPDLLKDPDGRKRLFTEAIRVGAEQNFNTLKNSINWRSYTAAQAALTSLPSGELRDRLESALLRAETYFTTKMSDFYDELLPTLRYRFRRGATSAHLAAAGAAVVEGLIARSLVREEFVNQKIPGRALDGGIADWHLAAIGFLGVANELLEQDPDGDPGTAKDDHADAGHTA